MQKALKKINTLRAQALHDRGVELTDEQIGQELGMPADVEAKVLVVFVEPGQIERGDALSEAPIEQESGAFVEVEARVLVHEVA